MLIFSSPLEFPVGLFFKCKQQITNHECVCFSSVKDFKTNFKKSTFRDATATASVASGWATNSSSVLLCKRALVSKGASILGFFFAKLFDFFCRFSSPKAMPMFSFRFR